MTHHHTDNPAKSRTEVEIQSAILERFGREPDVTLWRNNTGVAKSEVVTRAHLERIIAMVAHGKNSTPIGVLGALNAIQSIVKSLLVETPRFTRYGLCVGSSDIIGIVQREYTEPGSTQIHGVFFALEVKRLGKNPTKEQQQFLDLVNRRGGVGACVRSEEEAEAAINRARAL